ncbi:Hypothetical predicted protein [Mytilus galloprovincialis]|uniref:procollagen-proline 4-dioxygenase n=1 Tax=Mytilus galloprovincialis TaxID=29158 RepID=A0A8B6CFS4_MYTGA|nr:Hypothetical predicted protein [Mytilus galloprovincialis]
MEFTFIIMREDIADDILYKHFFLRLLNDLEPTVTHSSQDPGYAENPINAFHLIGRFVYKWPVVFANILCEDCTLNEAALHLNTTYQTVNRNIQHWPDEYDVHASAQALLRLRTFYFFDIEGAIDGFLFGEHCQPLSPSQALKLIRVAIDNNMLHEARLWCEALLARLPFTSFQDESINKMAIFRILATIYDKAGMRRRSTEILSDFTQLGHNEIDKEYEFYKNNINETDEKLDIPLYTNEYDDHYKQLCRNNRKPLSEISRLYCFLKPTSIPYYKAKVEIVNLKPEIYIFHDVISKTEAAYFRNEAKKRFVRSSVEFNEGDVGFNIDKSDVILQDEPGIVKRATHRVGLLTGLATKWSPVMLNAEPFQIVNYGIGGMYHPHYDSNEKRVPDVFNETKYPELRGAGDRIATWLYYLNDVKIGGATVFPEVNTRVPVIQGAAAFWYNLLPTGETDKRTLHAGCPVVIGSKWNKKKNIATKPDQYLHVGAWH